MKTTTGQRVKQVRKSSGLDQARFAKALGISNGHVSGIEHDKKVLTGRVFNAICTKFRVNPEWLESGNGEMEERRGVSIEGITKLRQWAEAHGEDTRWAMIVILTQSNMFNHMLRELGSDAEILGVTKRNDPYLREYLREKAEEVSKNPYGETLKGKTDEQIKQEMADPGEVDEILAEGNMDLAQFIRYLRVIWQWGNPEDVRGYITTFFNQAVELKLRSERKQAG